MDRYKVVFTSDQIRNTCACGIDPKIPLRDTERILRQNADDTSEDGVYRFGTCRIRMISFGIEVDGIDDRAAEVLAIIDKNWKIIKV